MTCKTSGGSWWGGLGSRALTPVLQLAPEAEHKPTAPASLRRVINNLSLMSVDRAFCLDQKHQRLERHLSARGRFTAGLASRAVSACWRWVYAFPSLIDRTPERGDHAHPSQFFYRSEGRRLVELKQDTSPGLLNITGYGVGGK